MQMVADRPSLEHRMEHDSSRPLSELQLRAVALLVEGEQTTQAIADACRISRVTLWNWRQLSAFKSEYRRQLAAAEQQAFDYAISRRVERVKALNETWLSLKEELAKRRPPRVDLVYALLAVQQAAAKELGQWQENVNLTAKVEVTEPVRVIRFVEQQPHPSLSDQTPIEGEYREVNTDEPTEPPDITLRGGEATPGEHTFDSLFPTPTGLQEAIEQSGLDPETVLTAEQRQAIYGDTEE